MKYTIDAAQGLAFLVSQLTHIESKVYEVKYQHITYSSIIPVSNEAGPGATSVTYFFMDGAGAAEFIGSKTLDVPISDIGTNKVVVPVELGGTGYAYTDEEIRQALHLNMALPQAKANMSRRAFEEHAQRVAMLGDTQYNLPGFLDNTNVPSGNVVNPGSGTAWTAKTPDQILFDINDLFGDIFSNTKMVERANKLLLPVSQWNYISATPRASNSDTTILSYVIKNSQFLTSEQDVMPVNELAGIGSGSTDRMMAYTKDPDKVVLHMPMPLIYTEPQRKGVGYIVPGVYKLGGTEFRYPLSAAYRDGI